MAIITKPSSFILVLMRPCNFSFPALSKFVEGSSKNQTVEGQHKSLASMARFCQPAERVLTFLPAKFSNSKNFKAASSASSVPFKRA